VEHEDRSSLVRDQAAGRNVRLVEETMVASTTKLTGSLPGSMEAATGSTKLLDAVSSRSAPAPARVMASKWAESVISPAGQAGSVARAGRTPRRIKMPARTGHPQRGVTLRMCVV